MVLGGVCGCGGMRGSGGHAWLQGGMHGCRGGMQGTCMVAGGCMVAWGWCAWLQGGMHGCGGHVWLQEACMVAGGCGCEGVCMVAGGVCVGYDKIRSMSGRYASYWNAFLFSNVNATFG